MDRQQETARENDRRIATRFSMNGRKALVTGGSLSIGREIALVFAEAGADVAIQHAGAADLAFGQPVAAEDTIASLKERGAHAVSIDADFARHGEATRCVEHARGALGGLDVLVICASIQYRTPFEKVTEEQMDRQIQINFRASVELLQAVLPAMTAQRRGRILTIGSINQTRPESELTIYAALKSAQYNLAFNLAKDAAAHGVTINNLSPGLIATERNKWRRQDADAWAEIERTSCPMQRAGEAREMAGAALLLCSDAGSYITGADLQATGGRHL
jgi:NAD(P)-dependent dehydrogenase (short-subunit alcohol dehydrogenase family)